jgi:hypothetical protein
MFIASFRVLGRLRVSNEEQAFRNLTSCLSFIFPPKYGALQCYVLHLLVNTDNRVTFKVLVTVNMRIAFFYYVMASSLVEGVRMSEEKCNLNLQVRRETTLPKSFVLFRVREYRSTLKIDASNSSKLLLSIAPVRFLLSSRLLSLARRKQVTFLRCLYLTI